MTFLEFSENIQELELIKSGLNLKGDFWDNFLIICNNSKALSKILDVPEHKIHGWTSKISKLKDKVKNDMDISKRSNILKTGLK